METNFRITPNYIFELLNTSTSSADNKKFHMMWVSGNDGAAAISVAKSYDPAVGSIDFEPNRFPLGGSTSNYRLNQDNRFQLYNTTTSKWHTIFAGRDEYITNSINVNSNIWVLSQSAGSQSNLVPGQDGSIYCKGKANSPSARIYIPNPVNAGDYVQVSATWRSDNAPAPSEYVYFWVAEQSDKVGPEIFKKAVKSDGHMIIPESDDRYGRLVIQSADERSITGSVTFRMERDLPNAMLGTSYGFATPNSTLSNVSIKTWKPSIMKFKISQEGEV